MYQTTPHTTMGVPPAELFLKWQVRMHLDLLNPSTKEHVSHQQAKQKKYRDMHTWDRKFVGGEAAMIRNF